MADDLHTARAKEALCLTELKPKQVEAINEFHQRKIRFPLSPYPLLIANESVMHELLRHFYLKILSRHSFA